MIIGNDCLIYKHFSAVYKIMNVQNHINEERK